MDSIDKSLHTVFSAIQPYLEASTIGIFSLSVVALLSVVLFIGFLRSKYLGQKKKNVIKKQESQQSTQDSSSQNDLINNIKNFLVFFINYLGFLSNKGTAKIFYKATSFLKLNIGGRNYAYKIPRYLMVGAANSGKSTLLETLNTRLMGKIEETTDNEKEALKWFFYDTGSFLEIPGEFFIKEEAIDSNQGKFQEILSLLVHFRVQKPIDGLVLTIPADELTTLSKLDTNSLIRRAEYVKSQLKVLQEKLGFILPIYVTITKCDLIEGFQEFSDILPASKLNDIFGWSSSFSLGENFSSTWIDEGFDYIGSQTLNNQFEVFAGNISKDNAEKILLLPDNIDQLRSPLKTYLSILFKKDTYQTSFFFRGIYLTSQTNSSTVVNKKDTKKTTSIAFIQNLIFSKIFPEYTIAYPAQGRLFSISKSTNIARFCMIFTLIVWGSGLWFAQKELFDRSKNVTLYLNKAYTLIQKQPSATHVLYLEDGLPNISEQSLVLSITSLKRTYKILDKISKKTFSSFFMPSSWISNMDSYLVKTVGIIVNRLVFTPIYYSLIYKLRNLIVPATENLSNYNNNIALFSPLSTPEFLLLQGYVESAYYFEKAVAAFYNLNKTFSISNVSDITLFLFNTPAPEEFANNQSFYAKVIKYAHPKTEVSIGDFVNVAKERAEQLFESFLHTIFKKNAGFALLKETASDLSIKGGTLLTVKKLESLKESMVFLLRSVSLETFSWINKSTFEPGSSYNAIIEILNTSKIFGDSGKLGDSFTSSAVAYIPSFQDQLASYWSNTTGPLLQISNNHVIAAMSSGFDNMLKNIHLFLKQPFMRPPSKKAPPLSTTIPAGKYIIWDVGLLEDITSTIGSFDNFIEKDLSKYPKSFQTYIKLLAQEYLNKHIISSTSRAQTLVNAPSSLTSYSLEDAIRIQVQNLKSVIPTFEKVLKTLEQHNMSTTYLEIRNLLISQAYSLLQTVDTFFNSEAFYEPLGGDYSWWDGSKNINFKAYNVDSNFGLQAYLNAQHKRIFYLSATYAKPLVEFLSQPYLHLEATQVALMTKWRLIIEQHQSFEKHKASNSVSKLEKYLLSDINAIDASNCIGKLSSAVSSNTFTTNWFSQKEHLLKESLYTQCQNLLDKKATNGYQEVKEFFNQYLAGRYPFVGGQSSSRTGEASPENIRSFFALYDQYEKNIEKYLSKNKKNAKNIKVANFIKSIKKVKDFFSGFLNNPKANALPSYKLYITFRTNRRFESHANQILTWSFVSGMNTVTNKEKKPSLDWQYGEPVSLDLQWTNGGPFSPTVDPKQTELSIEGRNAVFSENSPWALLELIDAYNAPINYREQNKPSYKNSLMFTVPVQSNFVNGSAQTMTSRLFIDIVIKEIEKGKATSILTFPYFPAVAPSI